VRNETEQKHGDFARKVCGLGFEEVVGCGKEVSNDELNEKEMLVMTDLGVQHGQMR